MKYMKVGSVLFCLCLSVLEKADFVGLPGGPAFVLCRACILKWGKIGVNFFRKISGTT